MARSYQQQLDDLDALIQRVEVGGESVRWGDRQITRSNVAELYAERRRLQAEARRAAAASRRQASHALADFS